MNAAERPLPLPDIDTAPFWTAAAQGELSMQCCSTCRALRFPPRPMCPRCRSLDAIWKSVSGRGTVWSYVVCYPPVLPAFADRAPYPVVLVELAEDPALRMVGGISDCPPVRLRIGLPVQVWFEHAAQGVWLPQWRPVDPATPVSGP
ncbi:MAG TPA: OB-fold domain-containing protein [Myxococcota bacterium]|nr:OB-fold domain-containing protein [Myxococcota bacterium]